MKAVIRIILVIAVILAVYIYIKTMSWHKLDREFDAFYEQGKYTEAGVIAKRQLQCAEEILFLSHFYIPPSLNNLARVCHMQGRYAEAISYYKRALKMAEAALGQYNLKLVIILENMSKLYRETGDKQEAQKLLERAEKIRSIRQ